MSDQIRLERGRHPSKPTVGSQTIRVFDDYDDPFLGVISQDGCFYLFECIAGRMLSGSFWVYSHIQSSELARLDDAEGAAFEEVVRDLQISRPVTFAVDFKDAGIIASVEVWEGPDGFGAALSELQDRVQEYVQGIVRTRDELTDLKSSPAWERMVASAR